MKTLSSTLVLLLFSCLINAQQYIGIKGGYTNAWEDYGDTQVPDDAEIDIETINASFFVYTPLGKNVQFGFEPGLVQRGANCIPGFVSPWQGDTRIKISYLNLPMNCKLNLKLGDWLTVYSKLGPEIALAVRAQEQLIDLDSNDIIDSRKMSIGRFGETNNFNFGLNGAAGIQIPLGKGDVILEGIYYHSLSQAVKSAVSLNRNVSLSVGYGFPF